MLADVAGGGRSASTGCFRCRSARKAPARSAATSRPMPAARPCSPMATARDLVPRPRSGAADRRDLERPAGAAQGQYRLRPARPLHRRRGHARHHHRRGAEAVPEAARQSVAFVGLADPEMALALFQRRARRGPANALTAFELMPRIGARDCLRRTFPGMRDPLRRDACLVRAARDFVLAVAGGRRTRRSRPFSPTGVAAGASRTRVRHGRRSKRRRSGSFARRCRRCRRREGGSIKHDVARAGRAVPELHPQATRAVMALIPGRAALPLRPSRRRQHPFQHQPAGRRRQAAFLARWDEMNDDRARAW